jgi:integrase/recombinase XerD
MYLLKQKYRTPSGQLRPNRSWHIALNDHLKREMRVPGTVDKAASAEMGRKLERLVALRVAGMGLDEEMTRFVAGLPVKVRNRLRQKGVLFGAAASVGQSIADELREFRGHLIAKGTSETHIELVVRRASRALASWTRWTDITTDTLQARIFDLKTRDNLSHQTFNFYLAAVNQFGRWMVRTRRASENPAELLSKLNVAVDRRHDRRALNLGEIRALLMAARNGVTRGGITGPERELFYRVALETGLRVNEIRSLTVGSFDLKADHPSVLVSAAYAKGNRKDQIPIPRALAATFAAYFGDRKLEEKALPLPSANSVTKYLKKDLMAAGVAYRDDKGEFADLHALRHSYITNLANAGVAPKVVQLLARHSTIRLTMDRYTHVGSKAMLDAVATLPDLLNNPAEIVAGQPKDDLQAGLQETRDTAGFCVTARDTNATPDKKMINAPDRRRTRSKSTKTGLGRGSGAGDNWRWRVDSNHRMTVLQTVA